VVSDILFAFLEVRSDIFYQVFGPGRFFLVAKVRKEGQAVAPFHLGHAQALSTTVDVLAHEGGVGVEDAEAEDERREVGEGFVGCGDAGIPQQFYFGQVAGEGSHEQFRLLEAGLFDGDGVFPCIVDRGPGFVGGWFAFGDDGEFAACGGTGRELVISVIKDVEFKVCGGNFHLRRHDFERIGCRLGVTVVANGEIGIMRHEDLAVEDGLFVEGGGEPLKGAFDPLPAMVL